jgi:predicted Zn-dependent protease with MMP-like domain
MLLTYKRLLSIAETEIKATLARLPSNLKAQVKEIPITCEPTPSDELLEDELEPDILGLFVGESFPDGESGAVQLPAQVYLFLENIWDAAEGDEALYRKEVRTTLLHELGHYLGLNEEELEERGLD